MLDGVVRFDHPTMTHETRARQAPVVRNRTPNVSRWRRSCLIHDIAQPEVPAFVWHRMWVATFEAHEFTDGLRSVAAEETNERRRFEHLLRPGRRCFLLTSGDREDLSGSYRIARSHPLRTHGVRNEARNPDVRGTVYPNSGREQAKSGGQRAVKCARQLEHLMCQICARFFFRVDLDSACSFQGFLNHHVIKAKRHPSQTLKPRHR